MNPKNRTPVAPEPTLFYVKMALECLVTIDEAIEAIRGLSKTNMVDILIAIETERKNLIDRDPAYAEADKLIQIFQKP